MFSDKTITCRDCGRDFVFTSGEQSFYQSRGLMNEPGRCPECRAARKSSRGGENGGGYASSGGDGSAGMGYAGYDRPRRELFPATCSSCGKETKVPFQPRGDKPVYCSECFETVRGGRGY